MDEENQQSNQDEQPKELKGKGRPARDKSVILKLAPAPKGDKIQIIKEDNLPISLTPKQLKAAQCDIPKKPLSEAQKANLQRLIEANKARRAANKPPPEIPEEVPEGYRAVYIEPTRERKANVRPKSASSPSAPQAPPMPSQHDMLLEMMKKFDERLNMLTLPTAKVSKPLKTKPVLKPSSMRKFQSETSDSEAQEPEESETGYDTSDTEYVKKYAKKTQKRIQAVKQIEEQLNKVQAPPVRRSKYDGMSLF
jgi:hypothetical protein